MLGAEAVLLPSVRDMAALVRAHVERVRRLDGFQFAAAIIVAETNEPYLADSLYYELKQQEGLGNAVLLHLAHALSSGGSKRSHTGELRAPDAQPGDLSPGIWTTLKNKGRGLLALHRAMGESRLHVHRDFITYSRPDVALEMQRAEDAGYDLARMVANFSNIELNDGRGRMGVAPVVPMPRTAGFAEEVHRALAAAEKTRIERLLYKEFGWMRKIVTKTVNKRNGLEVVNVRVTGKGGRDAEDGSERRDDLVMAFVMVVLGAEGFYLNPNYAMDRARLGLH